MADTHRPYDSTLVGEEMKMTMGSGTFPPEFEEVEFDHVGFDDQMSEPGVAGDAADEIDQQPTAAASQGEGDTRQLETDGPPVKVLFDDHQILGIELAHNWKALLRLPVLGATLTAAVRDVLISPATRPAPPRSTPVVTSELHRVRLERILDLDRKATRAFDALIEWLAEGSQSERRESRSGRVAVILRQGAFSEVVVDEPWAEKAPSELVAADLNEVLAGLGRRSALPAKVQQEIDAMHLVEADLVKLGNELR